VSSVCENRYVSFDGGVVAKCDAIFPDRYAFWDKCPQDKPLIPRGGGFSYAAGSFSQSSLVVEHRHFNRILSFDADQQTIEVEAGIELGVVYEFLTPRGFYLPVQPGHRRITVGGCIGADVHGKNQFRDGTFRSQVRSLRLFHPAHGILNLDSSNSQDIFELTCGGFGLTGNILSATLKVSKLPSLMGDIHAVSTDKAEAIYADLDSFARTDDLVYTWHNFTDQRRFGKGWIIHGTFARDVSDSKLTGYHRQPGALSSEKRGAWHLPFFNSLSTPVFNNLYSMFGSPQPRQRVQLLDFLFPVEPRTAYFRLFGKAGFMECQIIVPSSSYPEFVSTVRKRLAQTPMPITLASAKFFGGTQRLLRFSGEGVCLAVDFPRTTAGIRFAEYLDGLLPVFGARPNIIKDSRLPAEVVKATYPEYTLFRDQLRKFDPRRVYRSELSERLDL
jgi:decaprenylphospho-beta-D-ribofuranose 2-oxidase